MPKYNVLVDTDASPDQESGIQKATADYNAFLAANETPLTTEQYLTRVMESVVQSYAKAFLAHEFNIIAIKFEKADSTLRAEVKDTLAAVDQQEPIEEIQP